MEDTQGENSAPSETSQMIDTDRGKMVDTHVYCRDTLGPGSMVRGPAVNVEDDTTTVVSGRFDARVHPLGYIILDQREGSSDG